MSVDVETGHISSGRFERVFWDDDLAVMCGRRVVAALIIFMVFMTGVLIAVSRGDGPYDPVEVYEFEIVPDVIEIDGTYSLIRNVCVDEDVAGVGSMWLVDPETNTRVALLIRNAPLSFVASEQCETETFEGIVLDHVDGLPLNPGIYEFLIVGEVGAGDKRQAIFATSNIVQVIDPIEED